MTQEKINTKPGSPPGRETDQSYQAASTCTLFLFFNPPACRNYLKPHLPPSCGAGPTSPSYWVNSHKSIKEPEGRGRTGHNLVQGARPVPSQRRAESKQKLMDAITGTNRVQIKPGIHVKTTGCSRSAGRKRRSKSFLDRWSNPTRDSRAECPEPVCTRPASHRPTIRSEHIPPIHRGTRNPNETAGSSARRDGGRRATRGQISSSSAFSSAQVPQSIRTTQKNVNKVTKKHVCQYNMTINLIL